MKVIDGANCKIVGKAPSWGASFNNYSIIHLNSYSIQISFEMTITGIVTCKPII